MTQPNYEKFEEIRRSHALWAGGLGLGTVFIPLADLAVMITIWTSLLIQIGDAAGHPVDKQYAKKFAGAVVKGALLYLAGSRLGTWLVSLTGVGAPGAMAANAALNYGYTWLLGGFLVEQFSRPDVDLGGLAKAAVMYLLSFGISEVTHLQDLHDAATSMADAHHAATTMAGVHQPRFGEQGSLQALVSASPEGHSQGLEELRCLALRDHAPELAAKIQHVQHVLSQQGISDAVSRGELKQVLSEATQALGRAKVADIALMRFKGLS